MFTLSYQLLLLVDALSVELMIIAPGVGKGLAVSWLVTFSKQVQNLADS